MGNQQTPATPSSHQQPAQPAAVVNANQPSTAAVPITPPPAAVPTPAAPAAQPASTPVAQPPPAAAPTPHPARDASELSGYERRSNDLPGYTAVMRPTVVPQPPPIEKK